MQRMNLHVVTVKLLPANCMMLRLLSRSFPNMTSMSREFYDFVLDHRKHALDFLFRTNRGLLGVVWMQCPEQGTHGRNR